jgi:hypothetical protein
LVQLFMCDVVRRFHERLPDLGLMEKSPCLRWLVGDGNLKKKLKNLRGCRCQQRTDAE